MSKNLTQRIIVAAIGIPLLLFLTFKGGYFLYVFAVLVTLLGNWELAAMLLSKNIEIGKRLATALSIIVVSIFQFSVFQKTGFIAVFLVFFIIAVTKMVQAGAINFVSRLSTALLAAIYPAFLFSFAILIHREFPGGPLILPFIFVNIWIADTFAYGFGKWLGKRKLAPSISPNKTWVGFIAAFPGGLLAAVAVHLIFGGYLPLWTWILASVTATLFGQIGDLAESAIKRDCGVKDSSNLIPGHGGVLDRFDSLFFALPSVYFALKIVG